MNNFNDYKKKLNYSTCNEDALTEKKALNVTKSDIILCLTGSGGPALNLLIENPKKIITVDFNPIQNWLLELKISAIKNLEYDEFCKFLGLKECKNRLELYDKIKDNLSDLSFKYWEKNKRDIKKGILYQGKLEKVYKISSNILKLSMGEKLDKMFSFINLEDQIKFYETEWKTDPNWKEYLKHSESIYFNNKDIEPAYYDLGEDYDFEDFCSQLGDKGFKKHLVRENHLLCLSIDGSYDRVSILPLWLQRDNYHILKENIHKIHIVTENIISYLKNSPMNSIDKFAVSNVTDYLNEEDYNNFYRYVINCSRPNGKICIRNIVQRPILSDFTKNIIRDEKLEKELENNDLALEYKIIVGKIIK